MHFALNIAIIFVTFGLVVAAPVQDRILIAEIKGAAKSTEKTLLRNALVTFLELDEAIINAQVLDEFRMQQIRDHRNQAVPLLERGQWANSDVGDVVQSFARILSLKGLTPASRERLNELTKGAFNDIYDKSLQNINKELRLFVYASNPKVRQISEATQQSNQELITAFNNVAYAGLVTVEDSFDRLLEVLENY